MVPVCVWRHGRAASDVLTVMPTDWHDGEQKRVAAVKIGRRPPWGSAEILSAATGTSAPHAPHLRFYFHRAGYKNR